MSKFKRVSVTLPVELLARIDEQSSKNGMTRQQTLAALVDMGLRGAIWPNAKAVGVIGPLEAITLVRKAQANSGDFPWAYRLLRDAIYDHLTALVGGQK